MESEIELLSPAGDFECLKAAVQNGANCIYFGANLFSARAYANNFDDDELAKAIEYCKIRGVKTNLTLNILIKEKNLLKKDISMPQFHHFIKQFLKRVKKNICMMIRHLINIVKITLILFFNDIKVLAKWMQNSCGRLLLIQREEGLSLLK